MKYFKKLQQYSHKYSSLIKDYVTPKISGKNSGSTESQKVEEPVAAIYAQYCDLSEPEEIIRTQPRPKISNPRPTPPPPLSDGDMQDTVIAKVNSVKVQSRVKWVFNVIAGVDQGRQYLATTPEIKIGRKPENHICLKDPKVSRFHALICLEGMNLVIKDLNSANGTTVNGKKVQEEKLLSGDMFKVGDTIIQITSQSW
ncbi:MAG TPA: FHA domain-containing protein [Bacillota bacterium]|nr:FHA domain-containing protein [Bacillota bacterium]